MKEQLVASVRRNMHMSPIKSAIDTVAVAKSVRLSFLNEGMPWNEQFEVLLSTLSLEVRMAVRRSTLISYRLHGYCS